MSSFASTISPSSSLQGSSQSIHPLSVLLLKTATTQVQDPTLSLVEPHKVHTGPLLKAVQVPLDGIPSLKHTSCTTQLGAIHRLAEGALDPAVYVIDEDTE